MGINQDPDAREVVLEEYIKGSKVETNKSKDQIEKERKILDDVKKKMEDFYSWNNKTSFAEMAGQNCSDMLVRVGKQTFLNEKKLLLCLK